VVFKIITGFLCPWLCVMDALFLLNIDKKNGDLFPNVQSRAIFSVWQHRLTRVLTSYKSILLKLFLNTCNWKNWDSVLPSSHHLYSRSSTLSAAKIEYQALIILYQIIHCMAVQTMERQTKRARDYSYLLTCLNRRGCHSERNRL
jgi:hypothetical protein